MMIIAAHRIKLPLFRDSRTDRQRFNSS